MIQSTRPHELNALVGIATVVVLILVIVAFHIIYDYLRQRGDRESREDRP